MDIDKNRNIIYMTKETFLKLLFSCIKIISDKYPDNIYYYYDQNLIRKQKLNTILNKSTQIDLKNINTENIENILFEQDIKTKVLWINYNKIWKKIETYYGINYIQTKEMINSWLKDDNKLKQHSIWLKDDNKLKQHSICLKDYTNWKQYTPTLGLYRNPRMLKNDNIWKQYTKYDSI